MSNKNLNVSAACSKLLVDLTRTRNLKALGFLVRAGIARRDVLSGKEVTASEPDLTKITESKSRKRLFAMLERVAALTERKDISVFCAQAIAQRKSCRTSTES